MMRHRGPLLTLALGYLIFVVYGSLVPLEFRTVPSAEAWARFAAIPYLNLGIGSRADWVANILLFIPLSFLWLGLLRPRGSIPARLGIALAVWLLCVVLSVGIEFTQIFFPPRTVSRNDILAESIGAMLGCTAWWWRGPATMAWFAQWRDARGQVGIAERCLWAYLAVLFGYAVLPLDLTISPVEIYHKWQAGQVVLIPFSAGPAGTAQRVYELITDVALWVPVSLLWVLADRKRAGEAWAWAVLAALILECLQLLVYSRVTDVTDVILAGVGAGVGAWIGSRWRPGTVPRPDSPPRTTRRRLVALGSAIGWTLLLATVFWYPFDFQLERSFLRERLPMMGGVPLTSYYYGTEFRAVTELFHKLLFFAPLGVLLALARRTLDSPLARHLADGAAAATVVAVALGIELGQVALPGKFPSSTDWFLETLGGLLGYAGTLWLAARVSSSPGGNAATAVSVPSSRPAAGARPPGGIRGVTLGPNRAPIRPWLALAVTALGWLAYATLAPLTPLPPASEDPSWALRTGVQAFFRGPGAGGFLAGLYTWTLLGFLWQGAARRDDGTDRWGPATAWLVPGALLIAALGLALIRAFVLTAGGTPAAFMIAAPGLALGSLAWALAGRQAEASLASFADGLGRLPRPLAAALLLPVLLPLDVDAGITGLGAMRSMSPLDLLLGIPGQFYDAFKGVMLWVPVGLVMGLGGRAGEARCWALAGVATFVAVGLPWLEDLRPADLMEVLFAPLGVWIGTWVAGGLPVAASGVMDSAVERPARVAVVPPQEAAVGAPAATVPPAPQRAAATTPTPAPDHFEEALPATSPIPAGRTPPVHAAWARRGAVAAALALALAAALDYPAFAPWLAAGLAAYAAVLWRWPRAWLVVVPAALPLLDFAPWAGLSLIDGFDLLMLVTVAMVFWRPGEGHASFTLAPAVRGWLALFTLSWFAALLIALVPLAPLDANALGTYWSPYHALRVGKGLAWALLIGVILRRTVAEPVAALKGPFAVGMAVGLSGVILVGLRERWQFGGGLFDLDSTYRITATFSTMHTGGSHIEAYLVVALPFLWLLMGRGRNPLLVAGAVVLFLIGAFLTTLTVARGGVLGLLVGLAVLALGMARVAWTSGAPPWKRLALPVALLAATAGVLAAGVQGDFFQTRLARVEKDLETRLVHWRTAMALREPGWVYQLLGTGLGSFPRAYLLGAPMDAPPGTFRYAVEGGNTFLRLGSGETLYLAQRVAARPHTRYTLSLAVRSGDAGAKLVTPLCEKHLLNSHDCRWQGVPFRPGDGNWQRVEISIDTGDLGAGNWLTRRPTEFFFYNPAPGTVVDIDDVRLVAADGTSLLSNGDFADGGARWLFKTHDHLPYHIKSQPLALLFAQGWLGLMAFGALALVVLARLAPALWRGDPVAAVLTASLTAFLAVGVFSSPLDAPRIATLFYTVLILGGLRTVARHRSRPSHQEADLHA